MMKRIEPHHAGHVHKLNNTNRKHIEYQTKSSRHMQKE